MKLAAILALLAVIILPMFFFSLMRVLSFFKSDAAGIEQEIFIPGKKAKFGLIIFYVAILLGTTIWTIYEFTEGQGKVGRWLLLFAVNGIFGGTAIFAMYLYRSFEIRNKYPRPPEGATNKEIMDWQNRIFDESISNPYSGKYFKYFCVLIGLWILSSVLISFLLL